ncbi:pyridoxal phosphate-dependent aminotransferase [Leifsonia sp. SIMBA_070]|uniref:pyridoxal phosphate-dependent aminotransferase n=1 Tax=Leifsonia sp. SIMBA_070 TaxID=3085810 RepID=UPI00397E702A
MRLPEFQIERLFAEHEFTSRHNLTSSDVEGISLPFLWDVAPVETREMYESLSLGYTEGPGHPLLRELIADRSGIASAGGVQIFAGATEAAFVVFNALLDSGDHVVTVGPLYQLLRGIPQAIGVEVTEVLLSRDEDWALDVERIARSIRPNTRMIVANFPHNPTGSLPDAETFARLVDLAEENDVWLLSDEIYSGIESDPRTTLPAAAGLSPRAITLSGVSKVFGMAGTRIGWIACQDTRVASRLLDYRYWTTLATSAPSEILAIAALQAAPALLQRSRDLVSGNRKVLDEFVAEQPGWRMVPDGSGTCAYPWLEDGDSHRLAAWLIDDHGILLAPGAVFGHGGGHLRFGLGRADFGEGIKRLRRIAREHPREWAENS